MKVNLLVAVVVLAVEALVAVVLERSELEYFARSREVVAVVVVVVVEVVSFPAFTGLL